jgi:hypothetical protein
MFRQMWEKAGWTWDLFDRRTYQTINRWRSKNKSFMAANPYRGEDGSAGVESLMSPTKPPATPRKRLALAAPRTPDSARKNPAAPAADKPADKPADKRKTTKRKTMADYDADEAVRNVARFPTTPPRAQPARVCACVYVCVTFLYPAVCM